MTTISLSNDDKKQLMQHAHKLHPVVRIGQKGLTQAVHIEIERALSAHQLIKIKISSGDREQRQQMLTEISQQHQALLIHQIGLIGIYYRPSSDKI